MQQRYDFRAFVLRLPMKLQFWNSFTEQSSPIHVPHVPMRTYTKFCLFPLVDRFQLHVHVAFIAHVQASAGMFYCGR